MNFSKVKQDKNRVYIRTSCGGSSSSRNCTLALTIRQTNVLMLKTEASRKFLQPVMVNLRVFLVIGLVVQVEKGGPDLTMANFGVIFTSLYAK